MTPKQWLNERDIGVFLGVVVAMALILYRPEILAWLTR